MSKSKKVCDPAYCSNCLYIGEGVFYCDLHDVLVMEDFTPTDSYCCCHSPGKASAQGNQKTAMILKGGDGMTDEEIMREYVFANLMLIYLKKDKDWVEQFTEFLGTAVCDAGCQHCTECSKCALFKAMQNFEKDPTYVHFKQVRQIVGCKIHELKGGE